MKTISLCSLGIFLTAVRDLGHVEPMSKDIHELRERILDEWELYTRIIDKADESGDNTIRACVVAERGQFEHKT